MPFKVGTFPLKKKYYAEVCELVKKKVGCYQASGLHGSPGTQRYQKRRYWNSRICKHGSTCRCLPSGRRPTSLAIVARRRTERLQALRNISDVSPIENDHLAMLDEQTTAKPDDYVTTKDLFGQGFSVVQYCTVSMHVMPTAATSGTAFPR